MILCRGSGVLQSCAAIRDFKSLKGHIRRGCNVNLENEYSETALYVAAYYGEETMVDVLLQFGADPNVATTDGNTALHAAAYRGHARLLERLIAAGGDLRIANFVGQRVMELVGCSVDADSPAGDVVRKAFEASEQLTSGAGLSPASRNSRASQGCARRLTFSDGPAGESAPRNVTLDHCGFGSFVCQGGKTLGYLSHLPIIDHELDLHPDRGAVDSYRCGAFSQMVSEAWRGNPVSVRRVDAAAALREGCDRGLTSLLLNQAATEAQIIGSLRHPYILTLMGISPTYHPQTCDLTSSLVFERCHLGSLYHHLHIKFERCTALVALTIMRQISEALLFVHHSGLVHCGITSHAIHLIGPDTAKLGNFEYATKAGHRSTAVMNTHPNALYNWLPSEALHNDPAATSVDVYSLATVICECFLCEIPHVGKSHQQLLDNWSPPFDMSHVRKNAQLPDSLRGILRAALGQEARSRPVLDQLHRLVVYAFWNIFDQTPSPKKPFSWRERPKQAMTQEERNESSDPDELCVTSLDMPATSVRPRRINPRRVASYGGRQAPANASSSGCTTTTSTNIETSQETDNRSRRTTRARTLSGGTAPVAGSKPPLGSRITYRRIAALPKSQSPRHHVDLNVGSRPQSSVRSSSEEDIRMKPASHRVSREPSCVNIGDLTGTVDLIRSASRSSSAGNHGPLSGLHAHSTPVETTSASTSTNFSPDTNKGNVKARARCYRSEVHVELEMHKPSSGGRSYRQDFPRVDELIQRYECGDGSRSSSYQAQEDSGDSFPTPFMTALEADTRTPEAPEMAGGLRQSTAGSSTDPESLRRLLRDLPGCVVLLDGDTARRLQTSPEEQGNRRKPSGVPTVGDGWHNVGDANRRKSKNVDFFKMTPTDEGVTMMYGGAGRDAKARGKRDRTGVQPLGDGTRRQSSKADNRKSRSSSRGSGRGDVQKTDWKDPDAPFRSAAEKPQDCTWDCMEPQVPWEDVPSDDLNGADDSNRWDDGVLWPEDTAPCPDESLDTTVTIMEPKSPVKEPTVAKTMPCDNPKEKVVGKKGKKKGGGAEMRPSAGDATDGWMQAAMKMAKGGLEMLGRRSNHASESADVGEGGEQKSAPVDSKTKGKEKGKGQSAKPGAAGEQPKSGEALKSKKQRSSTNSHSPDIDADRTWTAKSKPTGVADKTWDQLEPSRCWEDGSAAKLEDDADDEASEYKSCCQTSPTQDPGSPPGSVKRSSPSTEMKTAHETWSVDTLSGIMELPMSQ